MSQVSKYLIFIVIIIKQFIFLEKKTYSQDLPTDTTVNILVDTVTVEETVYEYDTIFLPGDTIHLYNKETNKDIFWEISLKSSFSHQFYQYTKGSSLYEFDGYDLTNSKSSGGRSISLGIQRSKSKTLYALGLNIGSYDDILYYNNIQLTNDTINFTPYYSDTFYVYEDGEWITQYVLDTIWDIETDTIQTKAPKQYRFSIIEMPVFAGYRIWFQKANISFKAGIIPGILTAISYRKIANDASENNNLGPPQDYFRRFSMKVACSVGVNYQLYKNTYLSMDIFYQRNLFSSYKSSIKAKKYYNSYGLSIGLNYVFR